MRDRIQIIKEALQKTEVRQQLLLEQKEKLILDLENIEKYLKDLDQARWVLLEASKRTQTAIKSYIETLVTKALSIFDRDYKFLVDFQMNKDRTECILRVQEGGKDPYIPKEDQGGGLRDIVGLSLRIVLSSIENPRSRPILFLDEPLKQLGEYSEMSYQIVKEISEKLGYQIIVLTHDKSLVHIGAKIYNIEIHNGISEVQDLSFETTPLEVISRPRRKIDNEP